MLRPRTAPVSVNISVLVSKLSVKKSGEYVPLFDGAPVTTSLSNVSESPIGLGGKEGTRGAVAPKDPVVISPPPVVLENRISAAWLGTAEPTNNRAAQTMDAEVKCFTVRLYFLSRLVLGNYTDRGSECQP